MEVCFSLTPVRDTGFIPDLGPFKVCREELMATRSHCCLQSDIREGRGGEGWWHCIVRASSICPAAWDLCHQPCGILAKKEMALVLSRGFMAQSANG